MNILFLPKYTNLGASSRLRIFQYIPYLEKSGISVTILPLFPDNYILDLQRNKRNIILIIKSYIKRFFLLRDVKKYDLLWIEKELFPWLPVWVEKLILGSNTNYSIDFDDAVFYFYDFHVNPIIRKFLLNKHKILMENASLVTVGNKYLLEYAKLSNAKKLEIIPTVVDLDNYYKYKKKDNDILRVGWIGQYSSGKFLLNLNPLFKKMTQRGGVKFIAIGIDASDFDLCMDCIQWSEKYEVNLLNTIDIGIMPLTDGLFERGKCGYKLIQYMACCLPVVASPIGINKQLVIDGYNGFLANSEIEWENALNSLIKDKNLRVKMGENGRTMIERNYSLKNTAPVVENLLIDAVKNYY